MKNRFLESKSTLFAALVMSFNLAACSGKLDVKSGESPEVKPQQSDEPDAPKVDVPKTFAESILSLRVDRGLKSGTFGIVIDMKGRNDTSALTYLTTEKVSFRDRTDPEFGKAKIVDDGLARLYGLSGQLICEDGPDCSDFSLELKRKSSTPQSKTQEESAKIEGRTWWKFIQNSEKDITVETDSWKTSEDSPVELKLVQDAFSFTKALTGLPGAFDFPAPENQRSQIRISQMKVENAAVLFRLERYTRFDKGFAVKADSSLDPMNVIKEVTYELIGNSDANESKAYLNYTLEGLNHDQKSLIMNYTTYVDGIFSLEVAEDSSPEKLKAIPKLSLKSEKMGGSLSVQFEDTLRAKKHLTYPVR